ncbi:rab-GTPase-TBC domain-containing protein [Scheffersomyces coipomensis]|uniref:rab-GTPase-TBC domain-containing protein n=1 Tax=Scheffersomyces coipomensis TaxID=1788519 RepID=UPI00315E02C5
MIDYESLIEFEESLSSCSDYGTTILQNNIELKIECLRYSSGSLTDSDSDGDEDSESNFESDEKLEDVNEAQQIEISEDKFNQIFKNYHFKNDEFSTCNKCGRSLANEDDYQKCCLSYIEIKQQINSNLEKSYWISLLNNPTRTINTLPYYTQLLFLQQGGIPNQIRSLIWKKLFLLSNKKIPQSIKYVYQNFQHSYNVEISKQISKDLNRTFPTISFFKQEKVIQNLSTILNVYANYDVELGYCQGLLFLVGVLYHNFNQNSLLTFYSLINIMENEPQLHNIFSTFTMASTLNNWYLEFLNLLKSVDSQLFNHLIEFVEFKPFLYQWWLSFISSHSPDSSIINRIIDFCLIQGWKIGLFKISLGLIISNKPILMSLSKGEEEIIYQHLLNESKWSNVINNLDLFFGQLLLSWDEALFLNFEKLDDKLLDDDGYHDEHFNPIIDKFKKLSLNLRSLSNQGVTSLRNRSNSSSINTLNQSTTSVFSTTHNQNSNNSSSKHELESIYSDVSDVSSNENKSFTDYLKLPTFKKSPTADNESTVSAASSALIVENNTLKVLLKKAMELIDENQVDGADALKSDIMKVM